MHALDDFDLWQHILAKPGNPKSNLKADYCHAWVAAQSKFVGMADLACINHRHCKGASKLWQLSLLSQCDVLLNAKWSFPVPSPQRFH